METDGNHQAAYSLDRRWLVWKFAKGRKYVFPDNQYPEISLLKCSFVPYCTIGTKPRFNQLLAKACRLVEPGATIPLDGALVAENVHSLKPTL